MERFLNGTAGKMVIFSEGVLGYVIGMTLYDRFVGLVFAFAAGALGYLGKVAMDGLIKWVKKKRSGELR